jgi:hypothetical protein
LASFYLWRVTPIASEFVGFLTTSEEALNHLHFGFSADSEILNRLLISSQQILLLEIFLFIAGRRSFIASSASRVATTASQLVELSERGFSFKSFNIYPGSTKSRADCPAWFCNAEKDLQFWPEGISLQNVEDARPYAAFRFQVRRSAARFAWFLILVTGPELLPVHGTFFLQLTFAYCNWNAADLAAPLLL